MKFCLLQANLHSLLLQVSSLNCQVIILLSCMYIPTYNYPILSPTLAGGYTQIESVAEKSTYVRPRQLSVAISVGVILPLLVIGYMVSVGVYLLCREQRLRTQQRKALFTREYVNSQTMITLFHIYLIITYTSVFPGISWKPVN